MLEMSTSKRRILAIETAGRQGSVAIGTPEGPLHVAYLGGAMRHASDLMPAVQKLLARRSWPAESLTEVYVSVGPGSFTGLRIGVTVARTLGWSASCSRIVAVPTLDALARNAFGGAAAGWPAASAAGERIPVGEMPPHVVVVLDAKRSQVYAAAYTLDTDGICTRILGPVLEEPPDLLACLPRPLAILGEGIAYHRPAIDAAGVTVLDPALWPGRAESVFAVGLELAAAGQFTPAGDLLPLYIRRPEAEEKWEKLHPTQGNAKM